VRPRSAHVQLIIVAVFVVVVVILFGTLHQRRRPLAGDAPLLVHGCAGPALISAREGHAALGLAAGNAASQLADLGDEVDAIGSFWVLEADVGVEMAAQIRRGECQVAKGAAFVLCYLALQWFAALGLAAGNAASQLADLVDEVDAIGGFGVLEADVEVEMAAQIRRGECLAAKGAVFVLCGLELQWFGGGAGCRALHISFSQDACLGTLVLRFETRSGQQIHARQQLAHSDSMSMVDAEMNAIRAARDMLCRTKDAQRERTAAGAASKGSDALQYYSTAAKDSMMRAHATPVLFVYTAPYPRLAAAATP
jgi:hypothetical protein